MLSLSPSTSTPSLSATPHRPPSKNSLILPTLLVIAGFLLRIHRLDTQAFTGDEAFTVVNWTQASLSYLLNTVAAIDPQPPLALLSISAWIRILGTSEFAARSLSLFAGTVTVAVSYPITRRIANTHSALIACFLSAVNPFLIWHSQDLRPYSLWIATSALTLWTFLSATSRSRTLRKWVVYTLVATATMYIYYLEGFLLLAQNIVVATRLHQDRRLVKPWILSQLSILLLLIPWYLRPSLTNSQYYPTASMPDIPGALRTLLFGDTLPSALNFLPPPLPDTRLLIPLCLTITSLLLTIIAWSRKTAILTLTYSLTPILTLTALSLLTQRGYFRPRYIASTTFILTLTIALMLERVLSTNRLNTTFRYIISTILATIILVPTGSSLLNYYNNSEFAKAPKWRELATITQTQTAATDIIIFNYPDPAFVHYITGPGERLYLPTTPNPPQQQADRQIADLLSRYDHIWFFPVYESTWDAQQTIAKALDAQAQLLSDQTISTTKLRQYAAWKVSSHQIQIPLQLPLGNLATIAGYRTTPPQEHWVPGTTIHIELFWKPLQRSKKDLTVFCHLIGPPQPNGSPLWSQDDYPPQDGHTTTSTWIPGILIRDTYTLHLPTVQAPTTYTITIGLYDPQTNERYPLTPNTPQAEPNGATLLTFSIQ